MGTQQSQLPSEKGHSLSIFGPCLLWSRSPISATAELLYCHFRPGTENENAGEFCTMFRPNVTDYQEMLQMVQLGKRRTSRQLPTSCVVLTVNRFGSEGWLS